MVAASSSRTAGVALWLCLHLLAPAAAAQDTPGLGIVPRPTSLELESGAFVLSNPIVIVQGAPGARVAEIARFLADILGERTGFDVRLIDARTPDPASGAILLDTAWADANSEAYALTASPDGIRISGSSPAGLLWGVQTLRQLLPPSFENAAGPRPVAWRIPAVRIVDAPAYRWRGSLMDVSRHFFPPSFVTRYIDQLSRYKMNVLHWHLTDDQGWRLQIDSYPKLTSVGAWRTEPDGSRYGGFYTKGEVREIIEYARLRGVTIVPEIDMPGHASAALVAYPGLACGDAPHAVPTTWGVFEDVYCIGNGRVLPFLTSVLDEVAALFPSDYVHVGGDEAPTTRWEECEACQALIRREGLPGERGLQSWLLRRIRDHLAGLGKTMIGWDEILEGGGVPGSVIQVWRDPATIREAIEAGHDVIASPTSHAYIDNSPAGLPLSTVYAFDPTPAGICRESPGPDGRACVLGAEANLWSEFLTEANFDLMAFPRILAMAEVLWTTGEHDYASFHARLETSQYERLEAMGVRVGPENRDVIRFSIRVDSATGKPRVDVQSPVEGLRVRYSVDGAEPTVSSPELTEATKFMDGASVRLGAFIDGARLPLERAFSVINHLARGQRPKLEIPPDDRYPGPGPGGLSDGLVASTNYRDGIWQGWWGSELNATIDLGDPAHVGSIRIGFLRDQRVWILPPARVEVEVSTDGQHWEAVAAGGATGDAPEHADGEVARSTATPASVAAERIERLFVPPGDVPARYVRVRARPALLPVGHPGAGGAAWIFADEIVVRQARRAR